MRKKQMLALFMSLSLLAQGMLFGGCGQKSIGEQPAQTRMETEESQAMETIDSQKQDQTAADKTQDQDVARDEENGFALRFTEALLKQKKEGENLIASPYSAWLPLAALVNGCSGENTGTAVKSNRRSRNRRGNVKSDGKGSQCRAFPGGTQKKLRRIWRNV